MRYVMVTATRPDGQIEFSGSFFSHDPSEPLGQFVRCLAKKNAPGDRFGEETARKLHETIDPLCPGLIWHADVSRGG